MDELYDPCQDYSPIESSDDEETRKDLESRLYAEIYYAPQDKDFCSKADYDNLKNQTDSGHDEVLNSEDNHHDQRHGISNAPSTPEMQTNEIETPSKRPIKKRKFQDINSDNISTSTAQEELSSSHIASPQTHENPKSNDSHHREQYDSKGCNDDIQNSPETSQVIEKTNAKEYNSPKKTSMENNAKPNMISKYQSPISSISKSLPTKESKTKSPDSTKTLEMSTRRKEVEQSNPDTRYNVLDKQQKKKLKTDQIDECSITELSSDSDESIFEVPVPPKPQPPIVHVRDSDEDSVISIDDLDVKDANKQQTNSKDSQKIHPKESTLHEAPIEDIILNCTNSQKSASSTSEIQNPKEITQNFQSQDVGSLEIHSEYLDSSSENASGSRKDNFPHPQTESIRNVDLNHENPSRGQKRQHESPRDISNDPKRFRGSYTNFNTNRPAYTLHRRAVPLQIRARKYWEEYFFQPMSNDLKRFYTDSRGQEDFNLLQVQNNMRKDPRLWAISDEDLYPVNRRHRFWNIRCAHCQREGHHKNNCPEPQNPPCCRICGNPNHSGSKCTEKMCLTCGKKQSSFRQTCEICISLYCKMCRSFGHIAESCPDLWRRYHHTITNSDRIIPENQNVMKPKRSLYCCNCTRRGHDSSTCRQDRWSSHLPTPCYVSNYIDIPGHRSNEQPSPSASSSALKNVASTSKQPNSEPESSKKKPVHSRILYSCGPDLTCSPRNKNNQTLYVQRVCKLDFLKKSDVQNFEKNNLTPTFLEDLLKLVKFQTIMSLHKGKELYLKIITQNDQVFLSRFINKILILWLSLEDAEKDYFKLIILPMKTNKMIVSLKNKLNELEQNKEDPRVLWDEIKIWKNRIKFGRGNNISETELTPMKSELLKAQGTLNTILSYPNKSTLIDFIDQLDKSSVEKVPGKLYFKILFFFNETFHCCTKDKTEFLITYVSDKMNANKKTVKTSNKKESCVKNRTNETKSPEISKVQSNDTNRQEIPPAVPSTSSINTDASKTSPEQDNQTETSTSNLINVENQFAHSNENVCDTTELVSNTLDDNETEMNDEPNNQLLASSTFLEDDNDATNTEHRSAEVSERQNNNVCISENNLNQPQNQTKESKKKEICE